MRRLLKYYSTIFVITVVLIASFFSKLNKLGKENYKLTTYDCLGYYAYLPAVVIYHDISTMKWYPPIEKQYQLQGGSTFYQFQNLPNGHVAGKYFVGTSILQAPFFMVSHLVAESCGYPADGFSFPYQLAVGIAALFYSILALIILGKILLRYFDEAIVCATLFSIFLATNALQYFGIEGGQVHVYAFFLMTLVIHFTIQLYEKWNWTSAMLLGIVIGLIVIVRPTEAVALFIPLFWNSNIKWRERRVLFSQQRYKILLAITFSLAVVFIQLCYWKFVTDSWIHDVGSKWRFLTPHFRVLWGGEKGWWIYTPITIFCTIGLFKLKPQTFSKSVLIFSLLNIWIITAWEDWQYGGSYSCRALVQSLPIWAFAFASFLVYLRKYFRFFVVVIIYCIALNFFQIYQYGRTIIHYNKNNFAYYKEVYWQANPTAYAMSLLDGGLPIKEVKNETIVFERSNFEIQANHWIADLPLADSVNTLLRKHRIKCRYFINDNAVWTSKFVTKNKLNFPLFNAIYQPNQINEFEAVVEATDGNLLWENSDSSATIKIEFFRITTL